MFAILRFAKDNVVLVSLVAATLVVVIAVVFMMTKQQTCPKCDCSKCACPTPRCPSPKEKYANEFVYEGEYSDESSDEDDDDYVGEDDFSDEDEENENVEGYRNRGSKFSQKKNGKCSKGTTEIRGGRRDGMCIDNEYVKSGGSRGRSGRELAGRYLSGSKFRNTVNGECPVGTVKITSGSRKGKCMIDDGGYKHWGWGPNQGKRCRNADNTGCDDNYGYTKARAADYKYWGWKGTPNEGKMCRNSNNTGCDDSYAYSRARKQEPKTEPKKDIGKPPADGHWGWNQHKGMWCVGKEWNQGCSWGKPTVYKNTSTPLTHSSQWKYPGKGKNEGLMCKDEAGTVCDVTSKKPDFHWGWNQHAGMKCRGKEPNTGCSWS